MTELSLFSGAGGGLLGSILLGWRTVGAVEIDEYCCKVLEQRQKDGCLDDFPIWQMDIRDFNARVAATYTGLVDIISAGFPCQPFSVAGQRRGADDDRNMWPATIECIRIIRPRYCLLENVPGLIAAGYLATILGDLAESGYDVRWRCLSAAELGAPHRRDRLWIVGHATSKHETTNARNGKAQGAQPSVPAGRLARGSRAAYWDTEPDMVRVVDGLASDMEQIRTIGNGQVPAVVRAAWHLLGEED